MTSEVFVHARFQDGTVRIVGRCRIADRVGEFAYAGSWRRDEHGMAFPLHPERLPLTGAAFPLRHRAGLGLLADSAPDSWGRRVIEAAQGFGRRPANGAEWLLATGDERVGCLAFSPTPEPSPRRADFGAVGDLPRFADAFERIERGEPGDPLSEQLYRAGGSLGGVRPKAVVEHDGRLWIAKFQRRDDPFDQCLAEHATMSLARACGIDAAETRLASAGPRRVVLVARFDRTRGPPFHPTGHYLSALSALDLDDTAQLGSYPAFAGFLRRVSGDHRRDGAELFRRMVFNVLVGNRDDHLKNHAVIHRAGAGWRLTPAFDVVPQPDLDPAQAISVGRLGTTASLANCLSRCGEFGLGEDEARAAATAIAGRLRRWRSDFARHGADEAMIRRLEWAFARDLPPAD